MGIEWDKIKNIANVFKMVEILSLGRHQLSAQRPWSTGAYLELVALKILSLLIHMPVLRKIFTPCFSKHLNGLVSG